MKKSPKALTLIELLLTVIILSAGVVLILRSYIVLLSALDYSENKIQALNFLNSQAATIRAEFLNKTPLEEIEREGEITINNTLYSWTLEASELQAGQEGEEGSGEAVTRLDYIISWQEGGKTREEELTTIIKEGQ